MTFALDLAKFVEKAGKRADEAVGGIVLGLHAKVDARSPVGDATYWKSPPPAGYVGGHFRGNWQLGIGSVPGGTLARIDADGSTVRAEFAATVPEKTTGNVFYIANNLPYARRLEDGWSRQAPRGMVGLAMAEISDVVDQAVTKAKAVHP